MRRWRIGEALRRNTDQVILQCMALFGVGYMLLFYYGPMYGVILAFKDYSFRKGILGSPFVGLKYFSELVHDFQIPMVLVNTVAISSLKLLVCFPAAILFSVLLNELPGMRFKKLVQTVSYFPHFISWVIVSLMMTEWFSSDYGFVNQLMMRLGLITQPSNVLAEPGAFYWIAVLSELWKETGWSAIIFIAAIAGIDPSLFEAATVDGASRVQRIVHITLPSLTGSIAIMFMLNFSALLSGGGGAFEQSFFLGNALNYDRSIILSTYVLKTGISMGRFSYATAVGLLNSVVSLALLLVSNLLCKKLLGRSLYEGGER